MSIKQRLEITAFLGVIPPKCLPGGLDTTGDILGAREALTFTRPIHHFKILISNGLLHLALSEILLDAVKPAPPPQLK